MTTSIRRPFWAHIRRVLGAVLLLALCVALPAHGQDLLSKFEEKVTTFTLDNGLEFVVLERHDAPVVSFATYADVGAVDEPRGKTGLAHMFEHMAFKGTTTIGTKNIEKEMEALRRQEEIYLQLRRERAKGAQADSARIAELEQKFEEAQEEAQSYVEEEEFENILEKNGVENLNAFTSADATVYQYSLPANKLELFFALESDRFMNPVLRGFYTERDVVMEERRGRYESAPFGRLREAFRTTAFKAHPYGEAGIGHMSDLKNFSRTDAKQFFEKYYSASNLTIGIAGDVSPDRAKELAQKYFSRLPAGEEPMPVTTKEPEHRGERRVALEGQSQPLFMIGYQRPNMHSSEDPVYDVLADVLAGGRTSRLYKRLVETEKALTVQTGGFFKEYPGGKYDNQFVIFGAPNRGVSVDSVEQAIYDELQAIKEDGITAEELERAKTQARSNLIGELDSNLGLARQFAEAEALTGNWRTVFRTLEEIEAVTVEDVQRVATETFERISRTVALIETPKNEEQSMTSAN